MKKVPVRILDISNTEVKLLGPLKGKPLEELYCDDNEITNIEALSGMGEMYAFSCKNNLISDLSPLIQHSSLTEFYCGGNPVSDLKPLKNVPVRILDISNTKVTSVAPLKDHKHLRTLYCTGCDIVDFDLLGPEVEILK